MYYFNQIPSDPVVLDSISSERNNAYYKLGIVYDICLDESHTIAKQSKAGSAYIGAIRFRDKSSTSSDASKLAIAHPSDKNFINMIKNILSCLLIKSLL